MELSELKKIFNRYFLASFAIHILILFLVKDYFIAPVSEIYQDLEIEIEEKEKERPKPVEKKKKIIKPIDIVKPEKRLKKRIKKIPREIELPPRPLDKKAKLSLFKDGTGVRGKPKKLPPKKIESPVTTPQKRVTEKQILVRPRKKTSTPQKNKPSSYRGTSKDLFYPFKTEDMYVHPSPTPAVSEKAKKKLLEQILANLDEYIKTDKFDDSELFADSMLTFGDENFRYLWYGRVVKKKVVNGWYPPIAAKLGLTGKAVVTFSILRDGSVDGIKLKESTGNKSLDRASLNAIKSAGPFPPLPEDYEYDQLGVVFSFWYNLSRSGS